MIGKGRSDFTTKVTVVITRNAHRFKRARAGSAPPRGGSVNRRGAHRRKRATAGKFRSGSRTRYSTLWAAPPTALTPSEWTGDVRYLPLPPSRHAPTPSPPSTPPNATRARSSPSHPHTLPCRIAGTT